MDQRIILFRGMNTGGVRVSVGDQKTMALEMGLARPRTLLASGNLVVESDLAPANLETAVEKEMEGRFGLTIACMVRTSADWDELIAANPFTDEVKAEPAKVQLMVMKSGIAAGAVEACRGLAGDTGDAVEPRRFAGGEALYFWLPHGQSGSAIFAKATPRLLGMGTARNWNTVLKLGKEVGL
jgi:uncharacterized protein (DUF1697 family)